MAASVQNISHTLKHALFETLTSILSPNHDVRINAEQQINVLEVTDEFPVHLTELMLDMQAPLAIRQLASVLLKQYVESHWSANSEKFKPPETVPEAKEAVRRMLPVGLTESISKLRSSIAYAISTVAQWDWPEDWPELFNILLQSLISENSYAVHGAMRVLKEISTEVTDSQMPQFAPIILPEMLKIFLQDQKYGIRTRGRAVEIFITCTDLIAAMAPYNKAAPDELLFPVLTPFIEALVSALKTPDGLTSDSGLKKVVVAALCSLVKHFPKKLKHCLPTILSIVWNCVTSCAAIYVQTVVNCSEDPDTAVDSDGEIIGFENLILGIFEFIMVIVETPKLQHYVKSSLTDLLYYVIIYSQITEAQVRNWTANPNQFVEEEDDDTYAFSVRISAQDLLGTLTEDLENETTAALCAAVSRHIQETDRNSNPFWWKIHEACMISLTCCSSEQNLDECENSLNLYTANFIQSVVLEDLKSPMSPFLYGRCLNLASKFPLVTDKDIVKQCLQALVTGLQADQPPIVRVSCVYSTWGFCESLKENNKDILTPFLSSMMDGLISMSVQFNSDVLNLVMESLANLLSVDAQFTAQIESRVSPIAIAVFLKYNSDPVLSTTVQDIFKQLSKTPGAREPMTQRLLPTLVTILQSQKNKDHSELQAISLDILQAVVRGSASPISLIVLHAFPIAIQCILNTDDNSVLQNGGECLRAYVSVAFDEVCNWRDDSGVSGMDYIINVAQRMLDPNTPESACAFVGKLIALLITRASNVIGDRGELLLRAVLSKIQKVETPSVTQSLLLVFARLVIHNIEPVLDFLSGVPGPTGQSALEFVLDQWCQCHSMFWGAHDKKLSTFALALILQHGLKANDQRLQNLHVKGEQVFSSEDDGIKTRSKAKHNPAQWTKIPVFAKIYKLLLEDMGRLNEAFCTVTDNEDSSDEECELNGDSNHRNKALAGGEMFYWSNFWEKEEVENDPDIIHDPIYTMDLKAYLSDYLSQLMQLPFYSSFTEHLTQQEKNLLQKITSS